MRFTFAAIFSLGIGAVLVASGCTSGEETPEAANANSANTTIVVPKQDNSKNPYGSNANSKMVPYNGSGNTNGNPTLDNSKMTVVDTTRKAKPTVPTKDLPENSFITTEMNAKGYVIETRTFRGDQAIKKVERITVTPKNVTTKVYLKNGKVKDLPADKLRDFRIATVGQILEAVGEKLPAPNGTPVRTKEQTKKERESKRSN